MAERWVVNASPLILLAKIVAWDLGIGETAVGMSHPSIALRLA